jgi:hypothetical protein
MLIQREQQRYSDIRMDMQHDLEKLRKEQKKLEDVSGHHFRLENFIIPLLFL